MGETVLKEVILQLRTKAAYLNIDVSLELAAKWDFPEYEKRNSFLMILGGNGNLFYRRNLDFSLGIKKSENGN